MKSIVGVDISQRMMDEYNRRAGNQGLSTDEMRAVRVDVVKDDDEVQVIKGNFDVVVVRERSVKERRVGVSGRIFALSVRCIIAPLRQYRSCNASSSRLP